MKFAAAFALIALVTSTLAQFTVNSPANIVQCQPILFTWSGGVSPYFVSLIPAGQISAPPFKTFPSVTGNSYLWLADMQGNTVFNVAVRGSDGVSQYSSLLTVQPSSNSSCINTSVAEGSTAAPSASSVSGSATHTASGTTGSNSASSVRTSTIGTFGIAGLMVMVGAALF